jgi:hypothetical protein
MGMTKKKKRRGKTRTLLKKTAIEMRKRKIQIRTQRNDSKKSRRELRPKIWRPRPRRDEPAGTAVDRPATKRSHRNQLLAGI